MINVTDQPAHRLHDDVWSELQQASSELLEPLQPRITTGVNGVVARLVWPTSSQVSLTLARVIDFVKTKPSGDEVSCPPPSAIVRSVRERWIDENSVEKNKVTADMVQTFIARNAQ